jgi:rod shape-determining protein MreD
MMRLRPALVVVVLLLIAIVLQTTLFSQTNVVIPDLVMLCVMLFALTKMRPEVVLGIAFVAGLVVDLLGSRLLGLQGIVLTIVAYLAIRTRERAEIGRIVTALWAGVLTFVGAVLVFLIGILFGENVLYGNGVLRLLLLVPLANAVLAGFFAPLVVRLIDHDTTAFRYA